MSNIEIKKVKITNKMFLETEYTERTMDDFLEIKKKSNQVIHDDLKEAMKALDEHCSALCEQFKKNKELAEVSVTGFSIGGDGDSEGITLIGTRKLSTDKVLNLVSPFERFEDSDYKSMGDLAQLIELAKAEVMAYLFEDKHAPKAQTEIEFGDENLGNQ